LLFHNSKIRFTAPKLPVNPKFTLNLISQVHSHSSKVAHQTAVCEWSPFSSDCNYAYCFAIG